MVENNGELSANVLFRGLAKMPRGILRQDEIHLPKSGIIRLPGFLDTRRLQILTGHFWGASHQVPNFAASHSGSVASFAISRQEFRAWRQDAIVRGQRLNLRRICAGILN